jgi:hypothetical protein
MVDTEPSGYKAQLIADIRRVAQERVQSESLRSVARQVGFSPSGLQKFLNGATPYHKSFLRLTAWYRQHEAKPLDLSARDAAAALALLTIGMPEDRRRAATNTILDALLDGYRQPAPAWLLALQDVRSHGDR